MIIEFRVTNFRSFKDTQIFSMVAGAFSNHTENNTFSPELNGFDERLLRSAAIYGANASGKTNLLLALQFMQTVVLNSANPTVGIPYNPFKFSADTRTAPSEFEVTFIQDEIRYEYGFIIGSTRIEKEWLIEFVHARGRCMFERKYSKRKNEYIWDFGSFLKGQRSVWSKSTRPNALFLSTAIQLNSEQLMPVFSWFQKRLVIIVGATQLNAGLTLDLLKEQDGKEKVLSFMKEADLAITDLEVKREPLPAGAIIFSNNFIEKIPGQPDSLVKVTLSHPSDDPKYSSLELFEESKGTQEVFNSAGAWLNVFKNGEILLIDEIESSLHPLLVRFLIQKFHSNKNNERNSQLIFTTHNTLLLDQDLFRRDQIWFVEKDKDGGSKIYPLTDFKPRNDEALGRWYMRGRYGALPIINS